MKFKRVWFFGGDAKDKEMPEADWVTAYICDNGVQIDCLPGWGNSNAGYRVGKVFFEKLKYAKMYAAGVEVPEWAYYASANK